MSDTALIDWLTSGSQVVLPPEEERARRASEFAGRFTEALNPVDDLGPTEELHQEAIARRVWAVHCDLNPLGELEYDAVWRLLAAGPRGAIKKYLKLALVAGDNDKGDVR